MIGVIGTVPEGEVMPCGSPGPHGGNLDTLEITRGSRVFLPVFLPEALLALGDIHAAMGDGEVCSTASRVISRTQGLSWQEAYMLASLACGLQI